MFSPSPHLTPSKPAVPAEKESIAQDCIFEKKYYQQYNASKKPKEVIPV